MNWTRPLTVVVLALVASGVGALLASLGTTNELFVTTQWATPALATVAVVVGLVLALATLGRPWRRRARTPYW